MDMVAHNSETLLDHGRFDALWNRCLSPDISGDSLPAWRHILNHYRAPNRYYHNEAHIIQCLYQFDSAASLMENRDAIELAIWFHDIVLIPGEADNEVSSAVFFQNLVAGYFPEKFIGKVYEFILATTHHHTPRNRDESFLLDIDLSSLGMPWKQYLKDTNAILEESADFPDEESCCPNLKFLCDLLEKERIFYTDFFSSRYETRARENIQRYISKLKAEGHI